MSDRLKRFICRSIFFVCCLLPTLMVVKWVLFPKTVDDWNLELRSQLGVKVSVEQFQTPTPQVTLLKNVRFEHNNRACLELSQVKTASVQGQQLISLSHTQLCIDDLRYLLTEIITTVNQNPADVPTQIRIANLDLYEKPNDPKSRRWPLREVIIDVKQTDGRTSAVCKARTNGRDANIIVRAALNSSVHDSQFQWELQNESSPIDAWVFKPFFPWLRHCGDQCQFTGTVVVRYENGSLESGQITGTLANIDGNTLLNEQFDIGFSGMANLLIDNCELVDGRIEEMTGLVSCQQGTFDTRFVHRITKPVLNLHIAFDQFQQAVTSAAFENLKLGFQIHNGSLILAGNENGEVAYDQHSKSPLLVTGNGHTHPVSALVRALMPENRLYDPITRETLPLASVLPIPDNSSLSPKVANENAGSYNSNMR